MTLVDTWHQRIRQSQPAPDTALPASLDAALHTLPRYKDEAWRHTDPAKLHRHPAFMAQSKPEAPQDLPHLPNTQRLVFIDGHFAADLSTALTNGVTLRSSASTAAVAPTLQGLSQLLATDGICARVATGQELTLHIISLVTKAVSGCAIQLHHDIEVQGTAHVICEQLSDDQLDCEHHQTLRLRLSAPGANAQLLRIQRDGNQVRTHFQAELQAGDGGTRLAFANLDLGAALARNDIQTVATGSHCQLMSGYISAPHEHSRHDTQLVIRHEQPGSTSNTQHRALAGKGASSSIDGLIHILPAASKTQAEMRLANLLLSRGAEANAKPQLMIETDDVKCAHGVTYGQLDDDALFYLRSRGLDPDAARAVLIYSFLESAVAALELSPLLESHAALSLQTRLPFSSDFRTTAP